MQENIVDKYITKRIKEKDDAEKQRTKNYLDSIYNLFNTILNSDSKVGKIVLNPGNFASIGKKEVPCYYFKEEGNIRLILDYSFNWGLKGKSFDSSKIDFFYLRYLLAEQGIDIERFTDHPEYDGDPMIGYIFNDYLVINAPYEKEKEMRLVPKDHN